MTADQTVRRRRIGAILYALLVLSISSIPGDALPELPDAVGIDKLVHLILYCGLGFLLLRGYDPQAQRVWLLLAISVAYGLADEAHQWLIPGRTPSLLDASADAIGALIGVFLAAHSARARCDESAQKSQAS